jgi:hypothetical protein
VVELGVTVVDEDGGDGETAKSIEFGDVGGEAERGVGRFEYPHP